MATVSLNGETVVFGGDTVIFGEDAVPELTNPQNTPEPDGATLTIESNSDLGTLYSYSKTTAFTGTDEENAAEIIANGVGQAPVVGLNTRVVTGQNPLTPHYAGWVQDDENVIITVGPSFGTPTTSGATVTWTTDYAGDSTLEWGYSTSYTETPLTSTGPATSHSETIATAADDTLVYFRATTATAANGSVSDTGQFTTDAIAPTVQITAGPSFGTPTTSGATITWTTDYAGDSTVNWGYNSSLTETPVTSAGPTTSHSESITTATADTLIYYRVTTATAANGSVTSNEDTFTTEAAAGYGDDLVFLIETTSIDESVSFTSGSGAGGHDYTIHWNDTTEYSSSAYDGTTHTEVFPTPGEHLVRFSGSHIYGVGVPLALLLEVIQVGNMNLITLKISGAPKGRLLNFPPGSCGQGNTNSYDYYKSWTTCVEPPNLAGIDTSSVTQFYGFLSGWPAMVGSPDLSVLVMSSATSVGSMISGWNSSEEFDPKIDQWSIGSIATWTNFANNTKLTTDCYDRVCAAWGQVQTMANTTDVNMGNSTYSDATAHAALEAQVSRNSNGLNLIDGGPA